jgi:hypothetical protein
MRTVKNLRCRQASEKAQHCLFKFDEELGSEEAVAQQKADPDLTHHLDVTSAAPAGRKAPDTAGDMLWVVPRERAIDDDLIISASRRVTHEILGCPVLGHEGRYPEHWDPGTNPWVNLKKRKNSSYLEELEHCLNSAITEAVYEDILPSRNQEAINLIVSIVECKDLSYTHFVILVLLVRSCFLSVDLTFPREVSGFNNGCYPGRSIDQKVVMPILKGANFPTLQETAFLSIGKKMDFHIVRKLDVKHKETFASFCLLVSNLNFMSMEEGYGLLVHTLRHINRTSSLVNGLPPPDFTSVADAVNFTMDIIGEKQGKISKSGRRKVNSRQTLSPDALQLSIAALSKNRFSGLDPERHCVVVRPLTSADAPSQSAGDVSMFIDGEISMSMEITMGPLSGEKLDACIRKRNIASAKNNHKRPIKYCLIHLDSQVALKFRNEVGEERLCGIEVIGLKEYIEQGLVDSHTGRINMRDYGECLLYYICDNHPRPHALRARWNHAVTSRI